MRLLLHAYAFDAASGSEPGNAWRLSQALCRRGLEVQVLTKAAPEATRPLVTVQSGVTVHELPIGRASLPGVTPDAVGLYRTYLSWLRAAGRYSEETLPGWADVAQHLTWGSLQLGTGLSRLPVPFVFGPVGGGISTPRHLRSWFGRGWREEALRNLVVERGLASVSTGRRSAKRASCVLVMNRETGDLARRFGARAVVEMLQDGIAEDRVLAAPVAAGEPLVVWVGRMMWRKAPSLAILAFQRALAKVPMARMIMIGGGPALADAKQAASDLGVARRIEFTGQVPWAEVHEILPLARVHLFSSLRDQAGAQILETAAAGVPTVATTQAGAWRHLAPSAGWVADASRSDRLVTDLEAHLINALTDDDEWHSKAVASLALARRETWDRKAEQLQQVLTRASQR